MKKFISMALALVMTLSLCTFVTTPEASAAGFTDTGDLSKYSKQATEVIQEIEVMDGYDDGSFRPTAGLTRQAAAKIICNMILGPTTARALPTNANPFPDVIAGNQFSGYISYCSQQGIISGYGDGYFRPGDPLSGYAYLKMLLGALGYNQDEEGFKGDNWKVNVAKTALGIGLTKRDVNATEVDFDGAVQVTREDAAVYAFNTLQADMVEYAASNTIDINGVKINLGGGKASPQTWNTSSTSIDNINNAKSDGNNARPIVQFAERYFDKLVRVPNVWNTYTQDDFGRPSIKWFWKGVEIGTYSREAEVSFVGNVKVNAIYNGLGMTSGNDSANLYINSSIPNNTALDVSRGNDKDLDKFILKDVNGDSLDRYGDGNHRVDRIGNGTLIECFRNDANNHVDVCVISVYAGKVSAVKGATTKKDAYVTIDYASDPDRRPDSIAVTGNNEYETQDFQEDDVVAYTYSDSANGIKSMYKMTVASGALQSRISEKSLRLSDVTYTYGKEYAFDDITENDLSNKSEYLVYLDENDFALWIEEDDFAVDQYVLIERISIETTSYGGTKSTTASVINDIEATNDLSDIYSSEDLQRKYHQSKSPLGTSSWDARARLRFSNGTVRTVTLDDSKNYRTDWAGTVDDPTGSDRANFYRVYNDETDTAPKTGAPSSLTGTNNSGDGNGNWIAEQFTAGHIVRYSVNSGVYKLHAIGTNGFYVTNFGISNKTIGLTSTNDSDPIYDYNGVRVTADSETHFAIQDGDSWKTYTGIKNAPNVVTSSGVYDADAYIYHRNGVAKLVFVMNGNVSSSSTDIIFLAANSASKLITSSDIDPHFTFNAVEKGVIKTISVRTGTTLTMGSRVTLAPNDDGNDNALHCVILNRVSYDSNDLMRSGSFTATNGVDANRAQGVRRLNSSEVRLNTHRDTVGGEGGSMIFDLADNVKVFFVDTDGNIEQIEVSEIVNDTMDIVYYVTDDAEVTYLFIVDYEEEVTEVESSGGVWANGTIEVVSDDGTDLIYHYNTTRAIMADVRDAVIAEVDPGGTATSSSSFDGGYTFVISGIEYRVTLMKDANVSVEGAIVNNGGDNYGNYRIVYSYNGSDNRSTAWGSGAVTRDFLATSALTVRVRPSTVDGKTYGVSLSATTSGGNALDLISHTETMVDGYYEYVYRVPNANFTITVNYRDPNTNAILEGAEAPVETVEEAPAETPADSNDTPVVSNP